MKNDKSLSSAKRCEPAPNDRRAGPRGAVVFAFLAIIALVAAACGSSSKSSQGSTTATSTSAGTSSGTSSGTATGSATGSTPSGNAIKVGLIDPDLGAAGSPDEKYGMEAAKYYINTVMGGINGRPIDVVDCGSDGTPEKNISCANNFVQAHVVTVIDGLDAGANSEYPILHSAGIMVTGDEPQNAAGASDTQNYYFGAPSPSYLIGGFSSFKSQGYKSFGTAFPSEPGLVAYANQYFKPDAAIAGIKFNIAYYPSTVTDYNVIAQDLIDTHSDIIGIAGGTEQTCDSVITHLRQRGWSGPILAGACSLFVAAVGKKDATDVETWSDRWLPQAYPYAPPQVQAQIRTFESAIKATGNPDQTSYGTAAMFSVFVTLADIMKKMSGPITGTTVTNYVKTLVNFPGYMTPPITCTAPQFPGVAGCSNQLIMYKVGSDGVFKPVAPGFFHVTPTGTTAGSGLNY